MRPDHHRAGAAATCWRPLLVLLTTVCALLAPSKPIHAASLWYVSPSGDDTADCASPVTACQSISGVMALAASGDTLLIADGIYAENVVLTDKQLTLQGSSAATTVIDGRGATVLTVNDTGALVLRSITLRNGRQGLVNLGVASLTDAIISTNRSSTSPYQGVSGGGIANQGILTATQVLISDNRSTRGAGLWNQGESTLTEVVIRDNSASVGAGIASIGTLRLTNVTVERNNATIFPGEGLGWPEGGGILNDGQLTMIGGALRMNTTVMSGGGLSNFGSATLRGVTIEQNNGEWFGGGVSSTGNLWLTNVALVANSAGKGGGMMASTATLVNVTIAENSAVQWGGGISEGIAASPAGAELTVTNSTIAGNTGPEGANIYSSHTLFAMQNSIVASDSGAVSCTLAENLLRSLGHNLDSGATCGFSDPSDRINTAPELVPLRTPEGTLRIYELAANSPAIDTGDDAACPPDDQRGMQRPHDGDGDGSADCDIGAYEYSPSASAMYLPLITYR